MSKKKIFTVGVALASDDCQYVEFRSKASLLDWDIVLFRFTIQDHFYLGEDTYRGKPSLDDDDSFQLKDYCSHWRREIKQAVEAGKTVLVFLAPFQDVFVDTGRRTYSGTGRNQKTTVEVDLFSNYEVIPVSLSPTTASGSRIRLVAKGAEVISSYWKEFGACSKYEVVIEKPEGTVCLVTQSGSKPVGLICRSKTTNGSMILLPDINFCPDHFEDEEGEWTADAEKFASRIVKEVVSLDKTLKLSSEVTPEPAWAATEDFALPSEGILKSKLLEIEEELEEIQKRKEQMLDEVRSAGAFRALLYEKGKPLEHAIIEALRIFGFKAKPFQNAESEFDVVFTSKEGRLIGEAEGKDNKAVNVEKLRQLSMNIHEDLLREDVDKPAKPVLFGNPFRMVKPDKRDDPFTQKCVTAATSSSTALVSTPELFAAIWPLLEKKNAQFAKRCRLALLDASGRVTFPEAPVVSGAAKERTAQAS